MTNIIKKTVTAFSLISLLFVSLVTNVQADKMGSMDKMKSTTSCNRSRISRSMVTKGNMCTAYSSSIDSLCVQWSIGIAELFCFLKFNIKFLVKFII